MNVPLSLALKVGVVAFEGVHFAAEARLVLLVQDRSLLVVCRQAPLDGVVLELGLVEVFLGLVQLSSLTVNLEVLLLQGDEQGRFLLGLRSGILGFALSPETQLVGLLFHDLYLELKLVALSGQLSPGAALLINLSGLRNDQVVAVHLDLVPLPPELSDFILALSQAPLVIITFAFKPSLDLDVPLVIYFKLEPVVVFNQGVDLFFGPRLEVGDLSLGLQFELLVSDFQKFKLTL